MESGTQIAYIPMHAKGNINHSGVEFGFITSHVIGNKNAFCRYWQRGSPGVLRTTTSSELTPVDCLVEYESVDQSVVENLLLELY